MKLENVVANGADQQQLVTVNVKEKEGVMSQTDFRALCASLCADSPDKITKPRIGDVFRVSGFWLEDQIRHGLKVKQLEATSCVLLARGEISRPGDFADKIFYLNKEYSKEDQKKKMAKK